MLKRLEYWDGCVEPNFVLLNIWDLNLLFRFKVCGQWIDGFYLLSHMRVFQID